MDEEILMAIPMNRATQHRGRGRPESPSSNLLDIKQEPLSSPSSPSSDEDASSAISVGGNESPIYMPDHSIIKQEPQSMARVLNSQQSLLKQPTIFLTTRNNVFSNQQGRMVIPKLNIKVESNGSEHEKTIILVNRTWDYLFAFMSFLCTLFTSSVTIDCCLQKGSTGSLFLTEEEKRTLLAEGYPIPTRLPLTKAEEKSLKKIRRKIKNKISAQESRRKKKEYMDALEKRVENLVSENCEYKKKIESLEGSNSSLLSQLHKLQQMLGQAPSPAPTVTSGRSRTSASSVSHYCKI
ncbi:hypothetical protein B566_EDAN011746 [Ephemera danica]|nr:hypothetical protein B566_EDAN011746 [Ephemera danica]